MRHADTGERVTLVDGGVLSNYPIEIFDRTDLQPPRWPTIGVKVVPELPAGDPELFPGIALPALAPVKLLERVVATAIVGNDQTYLERPCVRRRTIEVDTSAVGMVEFDASGAAARDGDRKRRRGGGGVPRDVGLGRVPARVPAGRRARPAAASA